MKNFGWLAIVRLGLVQAALGAVVVLATSTLNRVMIVEYGLAAALPGALVAWHYAVQLTRPRLGHGSDRGSRRTPWIIGGIIVLACAGVLASAATVMLDSARTTALVLLVAAFAGIGLGVGAAGTSLLVLLAKRVDPARRAAAATVVWLMMIVGFAVTAGAAGRALDPFGPERLVTVAAVIGAIAVLVTLLAMAGLEGRGERERPVAVSSPPFREALAMAWREPQTRRFTVFVFLSMLAYSAQDLILEPFAGLRFGLTPGQTTSLSGVQHGGVLAGMLLATLAGRSWRGRRFGSLRTWVGGGCLASALALAGIATAGIVGPPWPLLPNVFLLGAANGAFSIAAIATMMTLAGAGGAGQEGMRMGLWGAAQAIAFGSGGLLGALLSDVARWLLGSPGVAYGMVFALEALLFVGCAALTRSLPAVVRAGVRAPLPTPVPRSAVEAGVAR